MTTKEQFYSDLDVLSVTDEVTPEQIKEIILKFIDVLQEIIKNQKVDDFLTKVEEKISDDKFGLFAAVVNAVKGTILKHKV